MKTSILKLSENEWLTHAQSDRYHLENAQLVLCFASKDILKREDCFPRLRAKFPKAQIAMCSTAGEIFHDMVLDHSMIAAAILFEQTRMETASVNIGEHPNSYEASLALMKKLPKEGLAYVLVLSDGSQVNGSDLVRGLHESVSHRVLITGGLAGDGPNFVSTLVGLNERPGEGNIIAIGLYGDALRVTHGTQGGWDRFGPEREVTRSEGNILYEIDHKNALRTYERYLGPEADKLPGSALYFPLSITVPGGSQPITRTILSVDRSNSSMTFAGDIPVGSKARFMKADFDKLTAAASSASLQALDGDFPRPQFSLLVSCVGRKLILGARIDEEVEAVKEKLGNQTPMAGFYSYGEISPFNDGVECQLHNQTMTITTFYELS